jgi:hypothetical protein
MSHYYKPLDKCVHGITVGGVGNDKNCVHCNEGYCQHGKKVEGALSEALEGCKECGRIPRKGRVSD